MLALTECRIGQPGIVAAAVSNPVVDWVGLDELGEAPVPTTHSASTFDMAGLLELRRSAFRKPEHYFDPFASPMLFFRSAGVDIPSTQAQAPMDDMEHLAFLERQDFYRQQLALSALSTPATETPEPAKDKIRRMTSKRYPSAALGLKLPHLHISTGQASPLREQAKELTHRLRQSFVREANAGDFGHKVLPEDEVELLDEAEQAQRRAREEHARDKARLVLHDDMGLWDDSKAGERRVLEVARWLRDTLR